MKLVLHEKCIEQSPIQQELCKVLSIQLVCAPQTRGCETSSFVPEPGFLSRGSHCRRTTCPSLKKPQWICLPPCKAGQPSTISCPMQGLHHKGLPRYSCTWLPVACLILRWLCVAHPVSSFPAGLCFLRASVCLYLCIHGRTELRSVW